MRILEENKLFLVVVKPAGLPTVPLATDPKALSLLTLLAREYPEVAAPLGMQKHEGLVLHRLDTATCGLVLVARDVGTYDVLLDFQERGSIKKQYMASVAPRDPGAGFPSPHPELKEDEAVVIESRFRPFGPKRKAVRPVSSSSSTIAKMKGGEREYRTTVQVVGVNSEGDLVCGCNLERGFRHQVRCHLAWTGHPIVGDLLYGGREDNELHLAATGLEFPEPSTGRMLRYVWNDSPQWTKHDEEMSR
jgi:23S rRNA pseudouridine1911/1915/1917 synthase